MYTLQSDIGEVKYVGKALSVYFKKRGIKTVLDLLNYFPYKYEDTSGLISVSSLYRNFLSNPLFLAKEAELKKTVVGVVEKTELIVSKRQRRLKLVKAVISDERALSDKLQVIWFNQIHLLKSLKTGEKVVLYGKVRKRGSHLEMLNPQVELYRVPLVHLGRLTPIYERIYKISSNRIRRYLKEVAPAIAQIKEYIPWDVLKEFSLTNLPDAYYYIHFPKNVEEIKRGYERLFIQEALELLDAKASLEDEQYYNKDLFPYERINKLQRKLKEYADYLPFKLTKAQQSALEELVKSMESSKRLLLYGDVGSGKTVVVFLIATVLADLGFSTLIMAPTSILAQQHYETFSRLLERVKEVVSPSLMLYTSSAGQRAKRIIVEKASIIIGTHALLHKYFIDDSAPIALLAIDEEHKFGILQREALKGLKSFPFRPYSLSLTATPIPRTLALSFYGYQKAVYIRGKPPGRLAPKTFVVQEERLHELVKWLREKVLAGEQLYMVYPRIRGDGLDEYALEVWREYLGEYFKGVGIGVLHGKLSEREKHRVLTEFREGKIGVLFSTTVIEVGIDVPSANYMVIFGPEHLGLAQLHQLRGRIGRNMEQAYCFLFTFNRSQAVIRRLKFFASTTDGIKIAEFDLKNRGPGDLLLGSQQHGWQRLKIVNLNNYYLLNKAVKLFNRLKGARVLIPRILTAGQS